VDLLLKVASTPKKREHMLSKHACVRSFFNNVVFRKVDCVLFFEKYFVVCFEQCVSGRGHI
jgi:hypothetical protein